MPRIRRIKLLGYFSNWGSLGSKPRSPISIIERFESLQNIPKNSWWYKDSQLLILYCNSIKWNISDLCRLFTILKRLKLQFSDLLLSNFNLYTNDLSVNEILVIIDSMLHNRLILDTLSRNLVRYLEDKDHNWKFDELCLACYNISRLNISSSLFDLLHKIQPEFTYKDLHKQLDICRILGITVDYSAIDKSIDLRRCSVESLISLANNGYIHSEIISQRLGQFSCSNLARLATTLHKLPLNSSKLSIEILYYLSILSHKLSISDSISLLKGFNRIGHVSDFLHQIIYQRIYHWMVFDPPSMDNYHYWRYLHDSNRFNNLPQLMYLD